MTATDHKGIEIRILNGQESIMFAITSNNGIKSKYQINTLKKLIELLKKLKDNQLYKNVKIGLYTPISKINIGNINDDMYATLLQALENENIILDKEDERE